MAHIPVEHGKCIEGLVLEHISDLYVLSLARDPSKDVRGCVVLKLSLHVTGLSAVGSAREVAVGLVLHEVEDPRVLGKSCVEEVGEAIASDEDKVCEG